MDNHIEKEIQGKYIGKIFKTKTGNIELHLDKICDNLWQYRGIYNEHLTYCCSECGRNIYLMITFPSQKLDTQAIEEPIKRKYTFCPHCGNQNLIGPMDLELFKSNDIDVKIV